MNEVISTILPASIATLILKKEFKSLKVMEVVLLYLLNTLIINALVYFLLYFILKYNTVMFTPLFTLKYIALSSFISFILGIVMSLIGKYFSLNIEVKKNEKKVK